MPKAGLIKIPFLCILKSQLNLIRIKGSILFQALVLAGQFAYSQQSDSISNIKIDTTIVLKPDSTKEPTRFGFAVVLTNNGISLVPSFSLGDPAVMVNFLVGKKRFSFEPDFRFSLKGKPWSFIFWLRYRLIEAGQFRFNIGMHPAVNFRTITTEINGDSTEIIQTRRFFAVELAPNYVVGKNITVGVYYLGSHGFDYSAPKWTHFLTVNSNFSNIKLAKQIYMRFIPQVYYLKQDNLDGYYWTASVGVAHKKFPLTVLAIFNQIIESEIPTKNFVWSLSLIYSFNKVYQPL